MPEDSFNFPDVTRAHVEASMGWFEKLCEKERWNLSLTERATILGGISSTKYENLLHGDLDDFPPSEKNDVIERLSILITIFKYLRALVGNDHAYSLFSRANSNPVFAGKSIKETLLANNSIEQFYVVRKYLLDSAHY